MSIELQRVTRLKFYEHDLLIMRLVSDTLYDMKIRRRFNFICIYSDNTDASTPD